jgi:hypothetical protein
MRMSDPQDPEEREGQSSRQTVAAVIVVVLLLLGGWWLMSVLQHQREVENCIVSGRRDCVPVENFK